MARIPQVLDYGARPSLRTNRVDLPGQGDLAVADALGNAANAFATISQERRQQDDARRYLTSKSELLKEDIRIRRELAEDPTAWRDYDERYRGAIKDSRDRTGGEVLSIADRREFDAEADLMVERGATSLREIGRRHEIDEANATLDGIVDGFVESIPLEDPAQRNDLVLTMRRLIKSYEDEGFLSRTQGRTKSQDAVQRVALASLDLLPAGEQEAAYKASIAAGDTRAVLLPVFTAGAPEGMTDEGNINIHGRVHVPVDSEGVPLQGEAAEQARESGEGYFSTVQSITISDDTGETIVIPTLDPDGNKMSNDAAIRRYQETGEHLGAFETLEQAEAYAGQLSEHMGQWGAEDHPLSGTLADFLTMSQKIAGAKASETNNRAEREAIEGYAVLDQAWIEFPSEIRPGEYGENLAAQHAEQLKYIRANTTGGTRQFAILEAEQRQAGERGAEAAQQVERINQATNFIDQGGTIGALRSNGEWAKINIAGKRALEAYASNPDRNGFASVDNTEVEYRWDAQMSDQEKLGTELNNAAWKAHLTNQTWDAMVAEQALIRAKAAAGPSGNPYSGANAQTVFDQFLLGEGDPTSAVFISRPSAGEDTAEALRYRRLWRLANAALVDAGQIKFDAGNGTLTDTEEREIIARTLANEVFVRTGINWWFRGQRGREARFVAELTAEERTRAFLPTDPLSAADQVAFPGIQDAKTRKMPGSDQTTYEWLQNIADSVGEGVSERDIEEAYFYLVYSDPTRFGLPNTVESQRQLARERLRGTRAGL